MARPKQNWITVMNHRTYDIQVLDGAKHDFGYRVNDPVFYDDRFNTVAEAVDAVEKKINLK
jgi:hypothetical protein